MASGAAKRYAQAIFKLAKERNTLDEWSHDLAFLARIVDKGANSEFLINPTVAGRRKIAAVESALNDNVQPETHKLVKMLVAHGRTSLIPEIRQLFDDQVRFERGVTVATVTTSDPLTEAERDLVREKLEAMTGQKVELAIRIDPAIIGGIIIRIGDHVIDGSVRNKLERMRARLVAG